MVINFDLKQQKRNGQFPSEVQFHISRGLEAALQVSASRETILRDFEGAFTITKKIKSKIYRKLIVC